MPENPTGMQRFSPGRHHFKADSWNSLGFVFFSKQSTKTPDTETTNQHALWTSFVSCPPLAKMRSLCCLVHRSRPVPLTIRRQAHSYSFLFLLFELQEPLSADINGSLINSFCGGNELPRQLDSTSSTPPVPTSVVEVLHATGENPDPPSFTRNVIPTAHSRFSAWPVSNRVAHICKCML